MLASERGDAAQQGVAVVRTGTRSIERCHRIVPPRIALLVVVLIAGCATGQRPVSSEVTRPVSESKAIAEGSTHPPAFFSRVPWSTKKDSGGQFIHIQEKARMQFPASAGEMDRRSVDIYDERTNDVGVNYTGALPVSKPECLCVLSVFVYPATEPLSRHLAAVRAEFVAANPRATATDRVLSLDASHGSTGVHAGYLNDVNSLESFEGISLYERGGWFVKYRLTIGPARKRACERPIRDAVAAMQIRG